MRSSFVVRSTSRVYTSVPKGLTMLILPSRPAVVTVKMPVVGFGEMRKKLSLRYSMPVMVSCVSPDVAEQPFFVTFTLYVPVSPGRNDRVVIVRGTPSLNHMYESPSEAISCPSKKEMVAIGRGLIV